MTFEVKYRNAKGEIDYISIDAEDRTKLFEELRNLKISAIQVVVQNGKSRYAKPRKAASSGAPVSGKIKGLMALVAVCVIGAVVFMFVSKDEPKATVEKPKAEKKSIEVVKPEIAEKVVVEATAVDKKVADLLSTVDSSVPTLAAPVASNEVHDVGLEATKKAKELGITATDQLLNMALTAPTHIPPPPLPITRTTEDEFRASLKKEITIKPDDSDEIKAIKQRMIDNRALLLARLDEGYTVRDVLAEHQDILSSNAKIRQTVMQALREFELEGNPEDAKLYLEKANEKLAELGVEPVYGSTPLKDRLGRNKANKGELEL